MIVHKGLLSIIWNHINVLEIISICFYFDKNNSKNYFHTAASYFIFIIKTITYLNYCFSVLGNSFWKKSRWQTFLSILQAFLLFEYSLQTLLSNSSHSKLVGETSWDWDSQVIIFNVLFLFLWLEVILTWFRRVFLIVVLLKGYFFSNVQTIWSKQNRMKMLFFHD